MMSKKDRTRQQMEEEMRQLRKVFMSVRLMKADEDAGRQKGARPAMPSGGAAVRVKTAWQGRRWKRTPGKQGWNTLGRSCTRSRPAVCRWMGQLCVLELTRKIDRSVLLDPENGERLLNSITDEREKRYRDR